MGGNVVVHSFLYVHYVRENWNTMMMKSFSKSKFFTNNGEQN